jgi:hypothetical protein
MRSAEVRREIVKRNLNGQLGQSELQRRVVASVDVIAAMPLLDTGPVLK